MVVYRNVDSEDPALNQHVPHGDSYLKDSALNTNIFRKHLAGYDPAKAANPFAVNRIMKKFSHLGSRSLSQLRNLYKRKHNENVHAKEFTEESRFSPLLLDEYLCHFNNNDNADPILPENTHAEVALRRKPGNEKEILVGKFRDELLEKIPFDPERSFNEILFLGRLVAFFNVVEPPTTTATAANDEMAERFRFLMNQFGPNENKCFANLTKKYNATEPFTFGKVAVPSLRILCYIIHKGQADPNLGFLTERLRVFYKKHCPEKLEEDEKLPERITKKYFDKLDALYDQLSTKYDEDPFSMGFYEEEEEKDDDDDDYDDEPLERKILRKRLQLFYLYADSDKVDNDKVEIALERYEGKEELMWEMLTDKYGPTPVAAEMYEARLMAFYEKWQPEKAKTFHVLKALKGFFGREEEMFKKLVGKYGPEPDRPATAATAASSSTDKKPLLQARARLVRIFEKYEPEKADDSKCIDELLEKFEGRESDLFEYLVDKYGPEPSAFAVNDL